MLILNKEYIFASLLLLLTLLTWPIVFEASVLASREIRYSIWALLLLFLLFNKRSNLLINWVFIFTFIFLFILESLYHQTYFNSFSLYSKIILIILYYDYLTYSKKRKFFLIKFWKIFSLTILSFSIMLFIIHSLTELNIDLFNWQELLAHPKRMNIDTYSILGKTTVRSGFLGQFTVNQSSGYFNEPLDKGIFCFLNLLIIKTINKKLFSIENNNKAWTLITIIAGIVTFSFGFILLLTLLIIYDLLDKNQFRIFLIFIGLASVYPVYLLYSQSLIDIFLTTSLTDRTARLGCGLEYILNSNTSEFLFGYGPFTNCILYNNSQGQLSTFGFSSGYSKIIVERGITAFSMILFFTIYLLRKNNFNIIFFLIIMLIVTLLDQYYALFSLLVLYSCNKLNKKEIYKYKI